MLPMRDRCHPSGIRVFFPFETMHAFKIAELAKFSLHNPDGMYTTAFGIVMNNDTYEHRNLLTYYTTNEALVKQAVLYALS